MESGLTVRLISNEGVIVREMVIPSDHVPGRIELAKPVRFRLDEEFDPSAPIPIATVGYRLSLMFKDEFSDHHILVYREEPL